MTDKTATRPNVAVWFELPAADFERAVGFYERIFGIEMKRERFGDARLAVFPYRQPGVSGCVISGERYRPSQDGAVVYLNCDGRLDTVLARVAAAGGKAGPVVELPDGMGSFAHVVDTEGNRIGLHTMP